jgi:histone H3/H4
MASKLYATGAKALGYMSKMGASAGAGGAGGASGSGLRAKHAARHARKLRTAPLLPNGEINLKAPAIRRLARRAGVDRAKSDIVGESRALIKSYLRETLADLAKVVLYRRGKTVTMHDLVFVLRRRGEAVYA